MHMDGVGGDRDALYGFAAITEIDAIGGGAAFGPLRVRTVPEAHVVLAQRPVALMGRDSAASGGRLEVARRSCIGSCWE